MESERVKPALCPSCGDLLDMAADPKGKGARPSPDDFSMCLNCGTILRWQDDMSLKIAEPDDLAQLPQSELNILLRLKIARRFVGPVPFDLQTAKGRA